MHSNNLTYPIFVISNIYLSLFFCFLMILGINLFLLLKIYFEGVYFSIKKDFFPIPTHFASCC